MKIANLVRAKIVIVLLIFLSMLSWDASADDPKDEENIPKLDNPITVDYLRKKLRKPTPRLVLNTQKEKLLKKKVKSDDVVQNMYEAIKLSAYSILDSTLLERKMKGKRLLWVSREMLYRINMLGVVYLIEEDPLILNRINQEVVAVCQFTDWNPKHFLDVAEMSLAVSLALDWTKGELPASTQELAMEALINKGLKQSWPEDGTELEWVRRDNNWNQVCHGGMVAAAITTAEKAPELAAKTIKRALDGLPYALAEYGPDGVYPEGSTYWDYGTAFTVATIAMLESALGSDFGIGAFPAFQKSAIFRVLTVAPSGWYYNFADCGDERDANGDLILAWFAAQTGNSLFFEKQRFLQAPDKMERLDRLAGIALVWLAEYEQQIVGKAPIVWKGEGANPVAIFTDEPGTPQQYYFGGKGGRGMVSHGNLDGGSFILEMNQVRWVLDPGNQDYNELEKTGFNLWSKCLECDRWKLLTKNNYGHSTITVNNQLHDPVGQTRLVDFQDTGTPSVSFDLTEALRGTVEHAYRRFTRDGPTSLLIEDSIKINENTETITWQMMTQADVQILKGGALLSQNGKTLKLKILSDLNLDVSVISLFPAPLELDRQIENLKRIEIRIPVWMVYDNNLNLKVHLVGG